MDVINVDSQIAQVTSDQQYRIPEISNNLLPDNVQQIANVENSTAVSTAEVERETEEMQNKSSEKSQESQSCKKDSSPSKQHNQKSLGRPKKHSKNANGVVTIIELFFNLHLIQYS